MARRATVARALEVVETEYNQPVSEERLVLWCRLFRDASDAGLVSALEKWLVDPDRGMKPPRPADLLARMKTRPKCEDRGLYSGNPHPRLVSAWMQGELKLYRDCPPGLENPGLWRDGRVVVDRLAAYASDSLSLWGEHGPLDSGEDWLRQAAEQAAAEVEAHA